MIRENRRTVHGHTYYESSYVSSSDVLDLVENSLYDSSHDFTDLEPSPWSGSKRFKITIAVEEL